MKRSVFLRGTVDASGTKTVSSEVLTSRFYLEKVVGHFPPNSQRKLKLRFWVGSDLPPSALNVFGQLGNVDYIVGDGNDVTVNVGRWFDSGMKLHAAGENTAVDERTIDIEAMIEEV